MHSRNDNAVTMTFGTILMVAITVILAAVAASVGFHLATQDLNTKLVAATATQTNDGKVVVTWQGGQDDDKVHSYEIAVDGVIVAANLTPVAGTTRTFPLSDPGAKNRILVLAYFYDGTQQIVLDVNV